MKELKRKNKRLILIILLLVISLGYALLNATLTINGNSKINAQTWDIHWNNVQVSGGSVAIGTNDQAATITAGDTTEVTYEVTLDMPGDFYEFTVDAVNGGTIDAMIDVITSTYKIGNGEPTTITSNNLPDYLEYSVSYSDDTVISRYQELKANTTETYKVRVAYKRDIDEDDLPENNQSIIFSFSVEYVQADSNATSVQHQTVGPVAPAGNYVVSNTNMYIGQGVPSGVNIRSTPELAMADWVDEIGSNVPCLFYLNHKIENDIITESYLEFVINADLKTDLKTECGDDTECNEQVDELVNGTYILRGGVDESSFETGNQPIYEANVNTIKQAFGTLASDPSICVEDISSFYCSINYWGGPTAYLNGAVNFSDGGFHCDIESDGRSSCDYQ